MKLCITDIETSSLNPITGEILEIGFIIADSETFRIYGKFNFKCIPEHIETASKKALEVNGYDPKNWKDAISLKQALEFFAKASEGCIFMGQIFVKKLELPMVKLTLKYMKYIII